MIRMTDIRTRHPKKIRKRTDGPGSIKKSTDGHELDLGIPWPPLFGGVLGAQHTEQGAPLPAPKQSAGKTEHKSVGP